MEILRNSDSGQDDQILKITDIKSAVKNQNRVNIYINDEYSFSLDIAQVVDFKIKVGQKISPVELSKYQHASEFGKLYQRTLEWVLTRPHSIKETRDYLVRKKKHRELENRKRLQNAKKPKELRQKYHLPTKELPLFDDEDINKVIEKLITKKYLNDENFVEYYMENRFVKKGISKKRLTQELIKKGIDQKIIEKALGQNLRSDEEEVKKMIIKKQNKYSEEKLIQYLVRQGFDYELVKNSVREMDLQN